MKRLLDMEKKSEIGRINWEFIHDMQVAAPLHVRPDLILLTSDFLAMIPSKWQGIKDKLAAHVVTGKTVHCALSDIENLGKEFKVRGVLHNQVGVALGFHKLEVYDHDRFEDDYIGAVITDSLGAFNLAFGKKTFSDFGLEAEPDIYFKLYAWAGDGFKAMATLTPKLLHKIITPDKHHIYDFGTVTV